MRADLIHVEGDFPTGVDPAALAPEDAAYLRALGVWAGLC